MAVVVPKVEKPKDVKRKQMGKKVKAKPKKR